MADDEKKGDCSTGDELQAGPELPGGFRPFVRHTSDHTIQTGVMKKIEEGEPIYDNAMYLKPLDGNRFEVVSELRKDAEATTKSGPAKVNTKAYRDNWDGIFGKKTAVGQA
jgi:hypothetical protein